MIPLNFGSFWVGAPLSYLRYLTFKTLRHFHPHSRIQLFTSKKFRKDIVSGNAEQEYANPQCIAKDYMPRLKELGVEIVPVPIPPNYFPFQQADYYRWWFLKNPGGIYLDPDQIVLKSFTSLPLKNHEFLYSSYSVNSPYAPSGSFSPIGVLGSALNSRIASTIFSFAPKYYSESCYDSMGVLMMADMIKKLDMSKAFNAPSHYFYPAPICDYMKGVYDGSMELSKDTYSVHWYGGCAPSFEFNKNYTEEFAKQSNDTISKWLRKNRMI